MFADLSVLCVTSFVGRLIVKSSSKPVDILAKLNQLAGFGPDEEIELYEVCFAFIFWASAVSYPTYIHICIVYLHF